MKVLMTVVVVVVFTYVVVHEQAVADEGGMVEVQLRQGRLVGSVKEGTKGQKYYVFLGIPYAKPPVEELRFKKPVAGSPWEGLRNGTQHPPKCPQKDMLAAFTINNVEDVTGSEDCLYLNVYSPRRPSSNQRNLSPVLAVMVFIHGGGWEYGSTDMLNPLPLVEKGVIVVTLQYRLGVLGFLSTEDNVLPGNLGLRDQALALRWVQNNIQTFGGNSRKVTVFGESAGSVSAHILAMSPSAQGLFQRAILQSGTALSPFALSTKHRDLAFKLGRHFNCFAEDSKELLECLKQLSLEELVNAPEHVVEWNSLPSISVPRVDGDFLPKHPAKLMKEGKVNQVDLISGHTKQDGSIFSLRLFSSREDRNTLQKNFTELGPLVMNLDGEEGGEYLASRAILEYLPSIRFKEDNIDAITQLCTDLQFRAGHEDTAALYTEAGRAVYQYQFDHRGEHRLDMIYNTDLGENYTMHGDDLFYLFDTLAILKRPEDIFVRDMMTNLWTNFAKTGNPTVNNTLGVRWPKVSGDGTSRYLTISTSPKVQTYDKKTRNFWRSLPTQNNKVLHPERFTEFPQEEVEEFPDSSCCQCCRGC